MIQNAVAKIVMQIVLLINNTVIRLFSTFEIPCSIFDIHFKKGQTQRSAPTNIS